jgi:hypothetical protein
MTTPFHTFAISQTQEPFRIIPYSGPPKPKQLSQLPPLKQTPSSEDGVCDAHKTRRSRPKSNTQQENRNSLTPVSHGVEILDLTCLGKRSLRLMEQYFVRIDVVWLLIRT